MARTRCVLRMHKISDLRRDELRPPSASAAKLNSTFDKSKLLATSADRLSTSGPQRGGEVTSTASDSKG